MEGVERGGYEFLTSLILVYIRHYIRYYTLDIVELPLRNGRIREDFDEIVAINVKHPDFLFFFCSENLGYRGTKPYGREDFDEIEA